MALPLLFTACATATWDVPGTGGRRLPVHDDRCFQPLRAYCSGSECPTYEDGMQSMQECLKGRCLNSERGVCGELRYTATSDGFSGSTRYFDSSGRLIAATLSTDAAKRVSLCQFWTHYGTPVTCQRVAVEKLR